MLGPIYEHMTSTIFPCLSPALPFDDKASNISVGKLGCHFTCVPSNPDTAPLTSCAGARHVGPLLSTHHTPLSLWRRLLLGGTVAERSTHRRAKNCQAEGRDSLRGDTLGAHFGYGTSEDQPSSDWDEFKQQKIPAATPKPPLYVPNYIRVEA